MTHIIIPIITIWFGLNVVGVLILDMAALKREQRHDR
jgi:hypothetical protein